MKASELDFSTIANFSASEWPEGVLENMSSSIILALTDLRSSLPNDHRMTPSPLAAAHVRESSDSRHSLLWSDGTARLSDATDFFMHDWNHAYAAWHKAVAHPLIGGVGFYLDKHLNYKNTPMLHIDGRREKLMWVCYKDGSRDRYVYFHRDPKLFFKLMGDK